MMKHTKIEYTVPLIVFFFCGLFAFWTLCLQISTLFYVPWNALYIFTIYASPFSCILCYYTANNLTKQYVQHIPKKSSTPGVEHSRVICSISILFFFLLLSTIKYSYSFTYTLFISVLIVFGAVTWYYRKQSICQKQVEKSSKNTNQYIAYSIIGICSFIVLGIVLFAHRPDFDDAEYIQLAMQILQYPTKAPNTFDTALGVVLENFRFAPYKFVSYESFVALLSQITKLNVLTVYYMLIPSISAVLITLVGFIFTRYFLPLSWSLLATVIYICVLFAWGETHIAFGNRVFVRLFQGKALLIGLTTPLSLLISFMWMRKPKKILWLWLVIIQVVAIGYSSTGIILSVYTAGLGLLIGFLLDPKRKYFIRAALGFISCLYIFCLAFWLKYYSTTAGLLEDIGTPLPIYASLGGTWRLCITFTIVLCVLLQIIQTKASNRLSKLAYPQKLFFMLALVSIILGFNPFLSDLISVFSAKNVSWRLAWAVPVPLIISIGLVYIFQYLKPFSAKAIFFSGGLLVTFLLCDPWTLAKNNNVVWKDPTYKVPEEYYSALEFAQAIRLTKHTTPTVLAPPNIGTWLTVVAPDFKLVMPGHGYPQSYLTIMDKIEYDQRILLLYSIDSILKDPESFKKYLDLYAVDIIVSNQQGSSTSSLNFYPNILYKK